MLHEFLNLFFHDTLKRKVTDLIAEPLPRFPSRSECQLPAGICIVLTRRKGPLAAQSRELPEPYSLPARMIRGRPACWYRSAASNTSSWRREKEGFTEVVKAQSVDTVRWNLMRSAGSKGTVVGQVSAKPMEHSTSQLTGLQIPNQLHLLTPTKLNFKVKSVVVVLVLEKHSNSRASGQRQKSR